MSKRIPLTQGKFAIVDDADFEWLNQRKWQCDSGPYSNYATQRIKADGKGRHGNCLMHRLILKPSPGLECDHINSDGLDNRRCNLRLCTRTQNQWNRRKHMAASSIHKGVYWHKRTRKWVARITVNGERLWLGEFDDETDAAAIYDAAARKHFGDFARPNVIEGGSDD